MASKRRLRRKACTGKRMHATFADAQEAAVRTRGRVQPYRCPHCNQWHVGHEPRAQRHARLQAQSLWKA
jgi:hypothetical protein